MVSLTNLSQKVNEIYLDYLKLYPNSYYQEDTLELTIDRILRILADMAQDKFDYYFMGQQFRVDVTIELTKIAMMMHPKAKLWVVYHREKESS